eukprot:jgi/Tetstr1/429093/TSEL_019057.t1
MWNDKVIVDIYKLLLKSQEWVENNDCMQLPKAAVAAAPNGATLLPTPEDASKVEEISLKVMLRQDSVHVSLGDGRSKKQRMGTGTWSAQMTGMSIAHPSKLHGVMERQEPLPEDHPFRDTFVCDDNALTCESKVEWEYYTHWKKSVAWFNPDMQALGPMRDKHPPQHGATAPTASASASAASAATAAAHVESATGGV